MGVTTDPPITALGADEGDALVLLRQADGLHRCYAKSAHSRTVVVGGRLYEHVADEDGVWVYAATL